MKEVSVNPYLQTRKINKKKKAIFFVEVILWGFPRSTKSLLNHKQEVTLSTVKMHFSRKSALIYQRPKRDSYFRHNLPL